MSEIDNQPTELEIAVARLVSDVLFAIDEAEDVLCVDNAFVGKLVVSEASFRAWLVFPVIVGGSDGMLSVEYPIKDWITSDEKPKHYKERDFFVTSMASDILRVLREARPS